MMPVTPSLVRIIFVFCFQYVSSIDVANRKTDSNILEDAVLNTYTLIRKYGYPCEIHHTTTEDGYVLEMHRIPYGKNNETRDGRPVVFLQHGLLSSSAEWVLMTPEKGFAYLLADAGYDVWMGNARGNTYSRTHISFSITSSEFWKFSWHEIGYYDVPAMVDYTIKTTGIPKIQYIAFSQGTTAFWVMTSTKPEYNDKFKAMHALAPVAYIGNVRSPLLRAIAPLTNSIYVYFPGHGNLSCITYNLLMRFDGLMFYFGKINDARLCMNDSARGSILRLKRLVKLLGPDEFLPNGKINELAGQRLCLEEAITQVVCKNLLFLICGFDDDQLNSTMLPVVLGHTPAGASSRQFIHFGQLYNSKKFTNFDHGWITNKLTYGTFTPPAYNMTAIRTPIYLHYADNDWLSTPADVDRLLHEVKSVIGKFRVPLKSFNHLDFVFANDAKKLLYDRIINIMSRFI